MDRCLRWLRKHPDEAADRCQACGEDIELGERMYRVMGRTVCRYCMEAGPAIELLGVLGVRYQEREAGLLWD